MDAVKQLLGLLICSQDGWKSREDCPPLQLPMQFGIVKRMRRRKREHVILSNVRVETDHRQLSRRFGIITVSIGNVEFRRSLIVIHGKWLLSFYEIGNVILSLRYVGFVINLGLVIDESPFDTYILVIWVLIFLSVDKVFDMLLIPPEPL